MAKLSLANAAAIIINPTGQLDTPRELYSTHLGVQESYTYETALLLSADLLAVAEEKVPEWLKSVQVRRLDQPPTGELAGPMAWPLLDAVGLAIYLDRYTPIQLGNALDHTTHGEWLKGTPASVPAGQEIVRVLRVVEYVGPRTLVERQVKTSLHGTRGGIRWATHEQASSEINYGPPHVSPVQITAVTLGEYPEVLEQAKAPSPTPIPYPKGTHGRALQEKTVQALTNLRGAVGDNLPEMDAAIEAVCRSVGVDPVEVYGPPPPAPTAVHEKPPPPSSPSDVSPDQESKRQF